MQIQVQGKVFDIQHYSIHDGPGIRTLVFLKGCALRCRWCANPESQKFESELFFREKNCIGGECLRCQMVCQDKAIFFNGRDVEIHRNRCSQCLKCVKMCPSKGLEIYGETKTVAEVVAEVAKDADFYHGIGGVTLSGGEALLQPEFAKALLQACKEEGYHTAIETCGYAPWESAKEVLALCDYIMFDIKSLDAQKHELYTGVSNQLILENFKKLVQTMPKKKIKVRTPVIPGFNDTLEDIVAIAQLVKKVAPKAEYELLKYHSYGESKYKGLGRDYLMGSVALQQEVFDELCEAEKKIINGMA